MDSRIKSSIDCALEHLNIAQALIKEESTEYFGLVDEVTGYNIELAIVDNQLYMARIILVEILMKAQYLGNKSEREKLKYYLGLQKFDLMSGDNNE